MKKKSFVDSFFSFCHLTFVVKPAPPVIPGHTPIVLPGNATVNSSFGT